MSHTITLSSRRTRATKVLFFLSTALTLLASTASSLVSAQATTPTLTLSFLDSAGNSLGEQPIPKDCVELDLSLLSNGNYTTASMNDTRAALNIYAYRYCQTPMGSTVGSWANTGNLANVVSIRWEGTAPSTRESGSFSDTPFPSNMAVQTKMPSADDWVMDPEKGKLLVALVSAVLAIGVFIGVYQVYQAAQYVAPPKKEKKPKTGLNVRKVKKQDAYFKKPAARQDDHQHAFQRLETPEPGFYNHNRSGARDSQYSDAATTFVDWGSNNNGHHQNGHSRYAASDSVSIDMREQSHHQNNRYNNNNATPDLAQFQDMEDPKSTRQRGRGGEVLVPMHTFESNYHHHPSGVGRSPVRRPSSSRSR